MDAFRSYRSDPEVARYQGWSPMGEQEACAFIDAMADVEGPRLGTWVQLGIACVDDDRLIGDIGLYVSPDGSSAQIGYSCAVPYQRQGLTTEALRLVISEMFARTQCQSIRAVVDPRNIPSKRLLARLGFVVIDAFAGQSEVSRLADDTYELPRPGRL